LKIRKNLFDGLASLGCRWRKPCAKIVRRENGRHRVIPDIFEILGDPIRMPVSGLPEFVGGHIH
jgi:hypothetical protein